MSQNESRLDLKLMVEFSQGNDEAFSQLMERNFEKVLNTITRFIGNREDSEDLTQEVFLRIYNARKRYVPTAKFQTWLYKIVTNLCLNYIRDKKKIRFQSIYKDSDMDIKLDLKDGSQDTPSKILYRKEIREKVKEVLQSLPANQRMSIILAKYEGLSYQEIAAIMGLSVQAIKSLMNRAKVNLKNKLNPIISNYSNFSEKDIEQFIILWKI